jgi:magnesium transporter
MVQEALAQEMLVARLRALAATHNPEEAERELRQWLDWLSDREVAEALFELRDQELAALVRQLSDDTVAVLVAELAPPEGASLLLRLSRARAADVLEEMAPDDAADVMHAVEAVNKQAAADLLTEMQPSEAAEVRELLAYPPHAAGGLMTTRVATVPPDLTDEQALAAVRRAEQARTETVYYLYVTDAERKLLGLLSLRELVLAPRGTLVGDVMRRSFAAIRPETDQEEVARLLTEKHLLALPVVDDEGRLLGIVTADDVAGVLQQEATEDIQHLGGSQPLEVPYPRASVWLLARKRVGWLLLLFVAEAYTGTVLRAFENELQAVVALTFFIPLLIGTGGNTGTQITTTLTRAVALDEVRPRDVLRVLPKEWAVALLLGAIMATAAFIRAWTLGVERDVGIVVGVTAACIVLWAATVAAVLPLVLRRLRLDPAVISGPFITTVVDGTGLIIYFEIARRLLDL